MKKKFLALLCSVVMLAGCSSTPGSSASSAGTASSGAGADQSSQIIVAQQSAVSSLDPHVVTDLASQLVVETMYNSLLTYTKTYGEWDYALCSNMDISDDGCTYTLTLRDDATFHNGDPVTADDVVFSLNRIVEKGVRAEQFALMTDCQAIDEHTVQITLSEPFAPFQTYLANPINAIVSRKITEENDDNLAQVDAGSGAFQLEKWDVGSSVSLKAYDGYWEEGLPVSDGVLFRTISDETSCATAIRNGEVDMILDATSTVTAVLQNASGLTITSIPGTFWEYLGMNCDHQYLNNPQVRQAIAWAIDRDAINAAVKLGSATVLTNTCIPKTHEAGLTTDTYPARDVEKASALLEQAGIKPGEITLDMKVGSDWQYQVDAGTMIKQQLAEVGINVEITSEDSGIFFDDLNSGNFDLTICGWSGFVDADEYLYNIFTSDGPYNQQNYSNPQVDELLKQARVTMDKDARDDLYRQAEQIIADDAPMAFLYMNNYTVITRDNITGFTPLSTGNAIFLKETSK